MKQKLKEDGPFYASVNYWTDQIYSAPFVLIEAEDDLNLDMFDNDMFVDYNASDIMDPETRVRMLSIFTAPGYPYLLHQRMVRRALAKIVTTMTVCGCV